MRGNHGDTHERRLPGTASGAVDGRDGREAEMGDIVGTRGIGRITNA